MPNMDFEWQMLHVGVFHEVLKDYVRLHLLVILFSSC